MPSKIKKPTKKKEDKATLYSYVKPINADFANFYGRRKYGSASAYVDHLIQHDRVKNKNHIKVPEIKPA